MKEDKEDFVMPDESELAEFFEVGEKMVIPEKELAEVETGEIRHDWKDVGEKIEGFLLGIREIFSPSLGKSLPILVLCGIDGKVHTCICVRRILDFLFSVSLPNKEYIRIEFVGTTTVKGKNPMKEFRFTVRKIYQRRQRLLASPADYERKLLPSIGVKTDSSKSAKVSQAQVAKAEILPDGEV